MAGYTVLEKFKLSNKAQINVEFPANFQDQQKNLLKLISNTQFQKIIDPATMRMAYSSQVGVKGLQALPYAPPKYQVITPAYLESYEMKQSYVKQVIEEQIKLGADILVSPYHYIHNTNVPATQRKNPVAEWFDLDVKLLKESIDYKNSKPELSDKLLYAGICLNGESLLDESHRIDLLNLFSSFDCDGYFIYVDCIDNKTNAPTLYNYIKTLLELRKTTGKPVIAGRLNSIGLGLICAGITGFSSGAARFESFYEGLYKEETDKAYNMYERYYFPELVGTIPILRKTPTKLEAIIKKLGDCQCEYCNGKDYTQVIAASNTKLHFLSRIHLEVENIKQIDEDKRIDYFISRVSNAITTYKSIPEVFKASDYRHLVIWKEVFEDIKKIII